MAISYSATAASVSIFLLTACGGGGGSNEIKPPPPPLLNAWTGPASYKAFKPETLDASSLVAVASADGAVILDGKKRNFQAKQTGPRFNFTAGAPWINDGINFTWSSELFNDNRIDSIVYPDGVTRADIGYGFANKTPAMDFISLCSPEQQHVLINAAAILQTDSNAFANKRLSSRRYAKGTCKEEGRMKTLIFDATGGAIEISTGAPVINISTAEINQLVAGKSLPDSDNQGNRTMLFYKFTDARGERMGIQEFVRYPADNSKSYIRIWY
ncbi:MAG: hypothetical protein ACRCU9_01730 [Iodobacter sp.]